MTTEQLNEKREVLYNIIRAMQEKPNTKETRALLYDITLDLEILHREAS